MVRELGNLRRLVRCSCPYHTGALELFCGVESIMDRDKLTDLPVPDFLFHRMGWGVRDIVDGAACNPPLRLAFFFPVSPESWSGHTIGRDAP